MPRIQPLALIIMGCLLVSIAEPSHIFAKPLRVGYFKVAPHAMPGSQGAPQGVAVEYFRLVAREMQLDEIEFIMLPLGRLLLDLEKNQIDMALLLARDAERVEKFVYPEKAFCVTKPSIAVSVSNPLQKVTSIEDLLPLSFHETPGNYHTAIMQDPRLQIEPLTGEDFTRRCYAMIVAGRIDACYQPDHYPIQFEAVREPFVDHVKILYLPDPPIGLYSVFSKASAPLYLKRYEKALSAVQQRHSYGVIFADFITDYKNR
ncbi:MAG: transporter substrate-binding domain-containing protein [Deltaproteobacteria bacterium]|nr:transporter substrate-binding domain-containing protein [Deltaproteobacteria bacterium]